MELLRDLGENEAYGAPFRLYVDLVLDARDDPRAAWTRYEHRMAELHERADRMEPLDTAIPAAIESGDADAVLELTAGALPQAKASILKLQIF